MCKPKLQCIICHKPYDNSFYDKGDQGRAESGGNRYLCSKACYSDWYDQWLDTQVVAMELREAQRKRTNKYYYINKDKWVNYKKHNQVGLAGAI